MKYDAIRNLYPQDRGSYGAAAQEAIVEFQAMKHPGDIADAEYAILAQQMELWEKIESAAKILCDAVNSGRAKDVAKAFYLGMTRNHRTLQNQAVNALFEFFKIYKDTAYDLRNWSAVVASAQVSQMAQEESVVFPLI